MAQSLIVTPCWKLAANSVTQTVPCLPFTDVVTCCEPCAGRPALDMAPADQLSELQHSSWRRATLPGGLPHSHT